MSEIELPEPDSWRSTPDGRQWPRWDKVALLGETVTITPEGIRVQTSGLEEDEWLMGAPFITPDRVEHAGRVLLAMAAHMRQIEAER